VRPGITGWAQVMYAYGASMDDALEKLQYDLYYIKNYSLLLDFAILFEDPACRGSRARTVIPACKPALTTEDAEDTEEEQEQKKANECKRPQLADAPTGRY